MALEYEFEVIGDSGWERFGDRAFRVYFSEPEKEFEKPPGILLLIAGYGGEANSNVYRKMRRVFADEYNLYVVQCNYMGWEFMQSGITEREINFAKTMPTETGRLDIVADITETEDNYNDMGPFQALDNALAVKSLMDIIKANGKEYDESRICCYGHSQGAYLAHMCNCMFPTLFTDILDNSSWLYPIYLDMEQCREQGYKIGEVVLVRHFLYRIMEEADDKAFYNLQNLYSQFDNKAKILSFHGEEDTLVACDTKKKLGSQIRNFQMQQISKEMVDNEIFKSAKHGLDADFLKMFRHAVENLDLLNGVGVIGGDFEGNTILTQKYVYNTGVELGIPYLKRSKRE